MPKTQGFKITIQAFVPIDKKDFGKQAAAFATIDTITKTGKLPPDFLATAHILKVDARNGSADVPAAPAADNKDDPANTPLTTDPLPEGAAVLEQADALDGSVMQTIKLADGTEHLRRISADQAKAEADALAAAGKPANKPKR